MVVLMQIAVSSNYDISAQTGRSFMKQIAL